ncbi:hypothetical protein QUA47_29210 [Microcoleus sp. MON2_D5]
MGNNGTHTTSDIAYQEAGALTIQLDKERNLGWNLLSIKEWLQLARHTCVTCPRTQPYIGITSSGDRRE